MRQLLKLLVLVLAILAVTEGRSEPRCPDGSRPTFTSKKICSCRPEGHGKKGSLIFVIDDTGSMGSVISIVRSHISSIISANRRFKNYVVATYGDPYRKHLLKTRNAYQVRSFLNSVRPHGGGDCPEMALHAVNDVADVADRNSVIILFTDASAKDAHMQGSVASKLVAKNIRFITVATGNLCRKSGSEYQYLAKSTGGRFAKLSTGFTTTVMVFIKRAVSGSLSFGVFPRSPSEMGMVLAGRCGCRNVRKRKCNARKPPVGPISFCPRGTIKIRVTKKVCPCRPKSPPSKKGSLIFVIDSTGSMGFVINSVKANIQSIVSANRIFNNYVIASFGDPYRRHVLKTKHVHQVRSFLSTVKPHGGGDCPEFALHGVRDAAKVADRNSVMFLFTDASAKDASMQGSVANQLAAKNIRFIAISTGNLCKTPGNEYKSIAKRTGGHLANLGARSTSSVMLVIKEAAAGRFSFRRFPRNPSELTKVTTGHCRCRLYKGNKCVGTGTSKPKRKRCPKGTRATTTRRKLCSCRPDGGPSRKRGSLVFVIDDTGSMGPVINSVKAHIQGIVAANRRFNDYVIATYGDPYISNVLKTKSAGQVRLYLNRVHPHGGGDCPEMAMHGVRDAAAVADRNSVLMLFTDATAKDVSMRSSVSKLLVSKNIKFIVVAIGKLCGRPGNEYKTLATETGGQFSKLGYKATSTVMAFVKRAVAGTLSFGVFPRNAHEMGRVMAGRCGCRFVRRRKCVKIGTKQPHSNRCPHGGKRVSTKKKVCSCRPVGKRHGKKGSLIFVIDDTSSMGSVIHTVKMNIRSILDANKRFKSYIIAAFGDPYRKHLRKTRNSNIARSFLNSIRPHGGGDCPEFALHGVRDAADAADRNSVMFLFTDASAKDAHMQNSVASKLVAKNIRLFVVATGNMCRKSGSEYKSISKRTGGRFSRLGPGFAPRVMTLIRKAVAGDLSFGVFPRNPGEMTKVWSGHCGCRFVSTSKCVGTGVVVPPHHGGAGAGSGSSTGTTSTSTSTSSGGGGTGTSTSTSTGSGGGGSGTGTSTSTSTNSGGGHVSGSGSASGSGESGWETATHEERFCIDPYSSKQYKPGQSWMSKADDMCFHYHCTKDPKSSHPVKSECLSADGKCIAATESGAEFSCKVGGSTSKCQCKKASDGSVFITQMVRYTE